MDAVDFGRTSTYPYAHMPTSLAPHVHIRVKTNVQIYNMPIELTYSMKINTVSDENISMGKISVQIGAY